MPDLDSLRSDQRLALRTATKSLIAEYAGTFSAETIERFLETSYDQFAGRATVAHFLPLLAERFARQRLVALAKVEGLRRRLPLLPRQALRGLDPRRPRRPRARRRPSHPGRDRERVRALLASLDVPVAT